MHLAGGKRISNSIVTKEYALQEPCMFQLKNTMDVQTLEAVISLQIRNLLEFFNFKNTMNADQILDTAEFIVQDFDGLSLRAIQHCFNMIKKSEYPFNKELYNTINGHKILQFLAEYDKYIDDYLFGKATFKTELDKYRADDRKDFTSQKLGNLSTAIKDIKKQFQK